MKAESTKEHEWLKQFVGDWTYEGEARMGPDKPPENFKGTESVRSLGELWILGEGRGEMPGGGMATTLLTLGYDPKKNRYVGTWIGSMMTHLWVYEEGSLDAEKTTLTLGAAGPSMAGDDTFAKYRDVIAIKSDDHRVLTSYVLAHDGSWQEIMTAHYRRRK
jgi:hypothetical protein